MNQVEVSVSPLPSTLSAHGGFCAMFEENAALRGQDAAVSWIASDGIHTLNWERDLRRVRTMLSIRASRLRPFRGRRWHHCRLMHLVVLPTRHA